MRPVRHRLLPLLAVALLVGAFSVCGACRSLQEAVDRGGLADNAAAMAEDPAIPDPAALQAWLENEDLARDTVPRVDDVDIAVHPDRTTWSLGDQTNLIEETLRFPSTARPAPHPSSTAVAWTWRKGAWGERPVVLWLPGARVSEDAFILLQHFFRAAVAADFDVVAWVPPHHMVRQTPGLSDGDGLFGIDLQENLVLDREMVREARTLMAWLRRRGVERIGLWGGSLGGSVAWLTASVEPVDHVALMIPIVDWRTMVLLPPEMAAVPRRLTALGFSTSLQEQALLAGSPVRYRVPLPSTRLHLRSARFDQLTPEETTLAFARSAGIDDVTGFDRSHASVLLTPAVFADYEAFLHRMRPAP